jgi:hypothetical protein
MQTSLLPPAPAAHRLPVQRLAHDLGATVWADLRARLAAWRVQRRRRALPDGFATMSLHMLRDVGAPDWLIDRAAQDERSRDAGLPF